MIIFDTDIFTHFAYGNEKVREKIRKFADQEFGVSIITRVEILRGRGESLLKAATEDELAKAAMRFQQSEELLGAFISVGFDEKSIQHFGNLKKQKNLKKMGRADMLIACIALAHRSILVSRNVRDFKEVEGLQVENWLE
ncbi:MAG: type II toxin-antitoxin system VapC family toxin [Zavarzinella sp.]